MSLPTRIAGALPLDRVIDTGCIVEAPGPEASGATMERGSRARDSSGKPAARYERGLEVNCPTAAGAWDARPARNFVNFSKVDEVVRIPRPTRPAADAPKGFVSVASLARYVIRNG